MKLYKNYEIAKTDFKIYVNYTDLLKKMKKLDKNIGFRVIELYDIMQG